MEHRRWWSTYIYDCGDLVTIDGTEFQITSEKRNQVGVGDDRFPIWEYEVMEPCAHCRFVAGSKRFLDLEGKDIDQVREATIKYAIERNRGNERAIQRNVRVGRNTIREFTKSAGA